MNRILKRPMFRMGGSPAEGITSGLGRPRMASADMDMKIKQLTQAYDNYRKQGGTLSFEEFSKLYAEENFNSGGRVGYQTGGFSATGLPGFLTQFGLNLLSTPPQGNIFQTSAVAAQDPFRRLQQSQAEAMKTASDREFARKLAQEERDFESGQLEKRLQVEREKIEKMGGGDTIQRIQEIADKNYEGDTIKAQREVDFATKTYPGLVDQYGQESVSTSVIDSTNLQKPKEIQKFVKQNPQLARQVVYDVRTGKAMRFVQDQTGKFALVPADSADIDMTGENMPDPNITPGLFGQETKPNIIGPAIERLGEEFSEEMYQTP